MVKVDTDQDTYDTNNEVHNCREGINSYMSISLYHPSGKIHPKNRNCTYKRNKDCIVFLVFDTKKTYKSHKENFTTDNKLIWQMCFLQIHKL